MEPLSPTLLIIYTYSSRLLMPHCLLEAFLTSYLWQLERQNSACLLWFFITQYCHFLVVLSASLHQTEIFWVQTYALLFVVFSATSTRQIFNKYNLKNEKMNKCTNNFLFLLKLQTKLIWLIKTYKGVLKKRKESFKWEW